MKTEYNAKIKSSDLGLVPQYSAHECPTPSKEGENVRRTEKMCTSCNFVLDITNFYFKKTDNCYTSKCKNCIKEKQRKYSVNKKSIISTAKKDYYLKNTEVIKQRKKSHNINLDAKRKARRKWENEKLKISINYRLSKNLRKRIFNAMKSSGIVKSMYTEQLIGCSISFLKSYIETLFSSEMSWDNYGLWHIDHIFPLSKTDLTNKQELLQVMNYKNLQPLWARDNIRKGNKIEPQK